MKSDFDYILNYKVVGTNKSSALFSFIDIKVDMSDKVRKCPEIMFSQLEQSFIINHPEVADFCEAFFIGEAVSIKEKASAKLAPHLKAMRMM